MKLAGLLLIVLCCSMTGIYLASNLSGRVCRIENAIALLGQFYDRLRYLQPTTGQLLRQTAALPQFSGASYLARCEKLLREGESFPVAWRKSVLESAGELGREEAELLAQLGEVLGSAGLEGQLSAIECTRTLLEERLERARQYRERHARLYRTLGVLCGAAIAIILA